MARRKAHISKGHFPVDKLPVELRIRIYEFYFETGDTIDIQRKRKTTDNYSSAWKGPWKVRGYKQVMVKSRKPQAKPTWKAKAYLPKHGTALLRVNKHFLNEALPVLYGKNTFQCYRQKAMFMFMDQSAKGMAHIRHFRTLSDVLTLWMKPVLRILTKTPDKLVRVKVIWREESSCTDHDVTAQAISKWLTHAIHFPRPEAYHTLMMMFKTVEFDFAIQYHDCDRKCLTLDDAAKAEQKRMVQVATRRLLAGNLDKYSVEGPLPSDSVESTGATKRLLGV